MTSTKAIFVFLIGFLFLSNSSLLAQNGRDYMIANSLAKQGKYQDAIPLYEKLLRQTPNSQPVVNSLLNCYVETKQYSKAISTTKDFVKKTGPNVYLNVRLGGFHILNEDSSMAFSTWNSTISDFSSEPNVYREVAREMSDRGLTDEAIDIYNLARERFQNPYLYTNDLATLYLKKGDYQNTAKEWMLLIVDDPMRTNLVQRRLFRFDDNDLVDALIVEAERVASNYYPGELHYQTIKELLIWLYSERELYRKAIASAKALEEIVDQPTFLPVFNLAIRLKSINQYASSLQALEYYIDDKEHVYRGRALEESVFLYIEWGQFLELEELVPPSEVSKKMELAISTIDKIEQDYPDYRASQPLDILKAEIGIDYFFNADYAHQLLQKTEFSIDERTLTPQQNYIKGRVALFDGNFTDARIFLTRTKKSVQTGDLAEKASYYLGYADFLNAEFEFSAFQFRALERNSTSYFANNALKIRNCVQAGTQKDSVTQELVLFSKIKKNYESGEFNDALENIESLLKTNNSDLNAEAIYVGFLIQNQTNASNAYSYVSERLTKANGSPAKEKLLWFAALSNYQNLLAKDEEDYDGSENPELNSDTITVRNVNNQSIQSLFEQIILDYPDGYYAQFARNYLRQMEVNS